MTARRALFDLYRDHLRLRGGRAPIASLVKVLGALGMGPPAVRTAVSRMKEEGWLERVQVSAGPGYALTPKAEQRLEQAAAHIYGTRTKDWDGPWQLLVIKEPKDRSTRDRLRAGLQVLGYAALAESTWLGARASDEVDSLLSATRTMSLRFRSEFDGDTRSLVADAWDLDGLAQSYHRWLTDAKGLVATIGRDSTDDQAFVVRSGLVHQWSMLLSSNPELPRAVLPARWPGDAATMFFEEQAGRLLPTAQRFVDACLAAHTQGGKRCPACHNFPPAHTAGPARDHH